MPGPKPLHDEQIIELTQRGWSITQIAAHIGCTTRTVSRARARGGVAQSRPEYLTDAELARIEMLLEDGWSLKEIARTIGRSYACLYRRFPGRGWTLADVGVYNAARKLAAKLDI